MCINLVVLRELCDKLRYLSGKFTQLTKILHDRRSRRSRQISSLKATSDHDDDVDDVGENDNDGQNISATLN